MPREHYERGAFFDAVRGAPFPGRLTQGQVDGMEAFVEYWEGSPFRDRRWLAYCLGTQTIETGWTMQPVAEYGRGAGRAYGRPHPETGQTYYGRGLVQITWHENYVRATAEINERDLVGRKVDLVNRPDEALEPDIAAAIMTFGMAEGWFTGHSLADYFGGDRADWRGARRIVNALDRADEIAGHARAFHAALSTAATTAEPDQPEHPAEPGEAPGHDAELALLIERIRARTGAREIILKL